MQDPSHIATELFRRIAVNIALGNTDDHARNHAAIWDGQTLTLAPAYDLDPCRTPGRDANQAMAYGRAGERRSNLRGLVKCASVYGLSATQASAEVDHVVATIIENWTDACDRAGLSEALRDAMWRSIVLNPGVLDDLS